MVHSGSRKRWKRHLVVGFAVAVVALEGGGAGGAGHAHLFVGHPVAVRAGHGASGASSAATFIRIAVRLRPD